MMKKKVLFVCVHNSARSQMAEELLRKKAGDRFLVQSAGLEPGRINPVVAELLKKEDEIDITHKKTQSVFDLLKQGCQFDYVITVCDESQGERCPLFPGQAQRLHWSFPDPSRLQGSTEDKMTATKKIKDQIEARIGNWLTTIPGQGSSG